MAILNLASTSNLLGKTTAVNLSTTAATAVLSNAASSGFILKVNSVVVTNTTNAAANITLTYYTGAALGGTGYPIVSTVSIPAYTSMPVVDSLRFMYLPDGTSIGATAGTANALTLTCAYEQITASAL